MIQLKPIKIISILISLAVIGFPVLSADAAEDTLIKKAAFTANELDFHYDFPEEIEENGQKYTRGFVSYMILDEEYETKTVHETDANTIKDLYAKKYDISKPETLSDIPKEKTIIIDGKDHTIQLEDIKYESVPILHRTADVSTTVKLTEDEIEDSMIYRYADEDTGRNVNVILQKSSVSETDEVKENSISFPVIFHRYGSEEYVINSKMIPISDGDSPLDEKYFPDVKAESDYADTDGEITALIWDGESYISGGEVCRNALATHTEHKKIYEVTYEDDAELPDADGFWAILCYGGDCEEYTGNGFDRSYSTDIAGTIIASDKVQSSQPPPEASTRSERSRSITGNSGVNQNLGREKQSHDKPRPSVIGSAKGDYDTARSIFGRKKK